VSILTIDGLPDLSSTQAFFARGNQAVTYSVGKLLCVIRLLNANSGTWHSPMVALNETVDFAVLIHENGVPDEDCQEVYVNPAFKVDVPECRAKL
jgi:ureidoglycolate lyase